jgi:hypothetical protein
MNFGSYTLKVGIFFVKHSKQQNYNQHSHEFLILYSVSHETNSYIFYFAEKLCPDNCTSQSQGTCDTTSGKCNCEDNFVGANCALKIPSNAECKSDLDCPENKYCFTNGGSTVECRNPCDQSYVCGYGAECEVKDRKAICTCSSSAWTGNPDPYVVGLISE